MAPFWTLRKLNFTGINFRKWLFSGNEKLIPSTKLIPANISTIKLLHVYRLKWKVLIGRKDIEYDNIQAPGHVLVSRGSKIHKTRNIAFGITQIHFFGVLYLYLSESIKNMIKISRFQRFSLKSPFYW